MPDHLGDDMRKVKDKEEKEEEEIKGRNLIGNCNFAIKPNFSFCFFFSWDLDEGDIELLKTYVSNL